MNPRRLIPYLVILLALVGAYASLRWSQEQKVAKEQKAKEIYDFPQAEITAVSLKRGKEEIELSRQGINWEITKPLKSKADKYTMDDLLRALTKLKMERDLGPGNFKSFGLEPPVSVLSFTVKGKPHQLALGSQAPGGQGYYVRKDSGPNILLINQGQKDSLDPKLAALRDKTLWAFNPDQVKSLQIHTGQTLVSLAKNGPNTWSWVGRPDFRVRSDRVQMLLRQLSEAQIVDFNPAPPKDLKAAGLAPQPKIKVTLATPKGTKSLFLGGESAKGNYAHLGAQGPLVQVGRNVSDQITKTVAGLEDRRLWSGDIMAVHRMVWGAPGKTWTAVKEKNSWKITGPDKAALEKPAPEVEWALISFQKMEYSSLLPQAPAPGGATFTLEFFDSAGKSLFRMDEVGKPVKNGVQVLTKTGNTSVGAVVPPKSLADWQQQMNRLTQPPPKQAK